MTALTDLLRQAQAAGFRLATDNGMLQLNGPRSHETLARKLLARKADVLAAVDVYNGTVPVLDWCRFPISDQPRQCVICGRITVLLDWDRRPCHKQCAEAAIASPAQAGRAA